MHRNGIKVLCLGLTIIIVTGLARARSTSAECAQSEQARQITCTQTDRRHIIKASCFSLAELYRKTYDSEDSEEP